MARNYNREPAIEKRLMDIERKNSNEKTKLIDTPTDKDPEVYTPAALDWKSLEKTRYNSIKSIESTLAKMLKRIANMETKEETDKSEYIGLLIAEGKQAMLLCQTIDKAIPNFYDPKTNQIDNKLEICILDEVESE